MVSTFQFKDFISRLIDRKYDEMKDLSISIKLSLYP